MCTYFFISNRLFYTLLSDIRIRIFGGVSRDKYINCFTCSCIEFPNFHTSREYLIEQIHSEHVTHTYFPLPPKSERHFHLNV